MYETLPAKWESLALKKHYLFAMYVVLVLTLQLQWNISVLNWEIRFSVSDVLLPMILFIYYMNSRQFSISLPTWTMTWLYPWILLFSAWLGVCLLIGYLETGGVSRWAFVNKFLGWFVLIGYLLVGGLVNVVYAEMKNNLLKILFVSSMLISLFSMICGFLLPYGFTLPIGANKNGRFLGFLVNANAFGLFSVFVVLLQIPFLKAKMLFSKPLHYLCLLFNTMSVICSGSRGASAALLVGFLVLIFQKLFTIRQLVTIALTAIVSISCLSLERTHSYLLQKGHWSIIDKGSNQRFQGLVRASKWWLESPIVGIGLGSFLKKQETNQMTPILTLHNTPFWLLTETGIIGFLIYAIFIISTIRVVYCKSRIKEEALLAQGGLAVMIAFATASLTTEVMYQRYLWFLVGLLLSRVQSQSLSMNQGINKIEFYAPSTRCSHLTS